MEEQTGSQEARVGLYNHCAGALCPDRMPHYCSSSNEIIRDQRYRQIARHSQSLGYDMPADLHCQKCGLCCGNV